MTEPTNRRRKDSAKLVWDTKPKRAPNPRDIEFQTAEIVIPNPKEAQGTFDLPLLATAQAGVTSLFPGQMGELPLAGAEIDKSKMNRLIWGDNLLAMQALLAQGYAGKIDLIYIDPPFASSADYTFALSVEGTQIEKEASIIERIAYTDTWEAGLDSYLDMMYPRLQLMKRLLSDEGSIYVHLDEEISPYIRLILDEVFGRDCFINSITWKRSDAHSDAGQGAKHFGKICDCLLYYSRNPDQQILNIQYTPLPQSTIDKWYRHVEEGTGRRYNKADATGPGGAKKGNPFYEWNGIKRYWRFSRERMEELDKQGRLVYSESGMPYVKRYLDESKGVPLQDLWDDIKMLRGIHNSSENVGYPTQKPESLLERIIKASSREGSLVADFFCGSGTTMAVAERLNRRWIGCNLDKVGLQVSRNRMVHQGAKPFLLENIGNYQRHMIYLSGSKIGEMQRIMLKLYGAEPRSDRPDFGVRTFDNSDPELVYVGYPDRPVTARKVVELAQDAQILDGTGYKKLVVLAWDYDYNYSTELESRTKALKDPLRVSIQSLTVPPEIYNYLRKAKNEAELDGLRDKITFYEKPYVKVGKPQICDAGDSKVIVSIVIERYVLMNFPVSEKQQVELRKAIKDNFAALIDYWAVDWDYDGITFRSTWQAIRGNGKRAGSVPIVADSPELPAGKRTIAVRLVDVFGNDASATLDVK
ncbi:site-specific DNA-methyltransferase [Leptolyngbya sp. GB1-A1]|uniref:site-specific DNA-methyltransferase n=1 Tax=Leptolyngbya sp. GB1-A1 TaxID=2933908 RepID=UPI003296DB3F